MNRTRDLLSSRRSMGSRRSYEASSTDRRSIASSRSYRGRVKADIFDSLLSLILRPFRSRSRQPPPAAAAAVDPEYLDAIASDRVNGWLADSTSHGQLVISSSSRSTQFNLQPPISRPRSYQDVVPRHFSCHSSTS